MEDVEKMLVFWKERKIDMFKDGVFVPGLTMKYLFNGLNDKTYFNHFNKRNKALYHLFRNNNAGGPSLIFMRYQEVGKTKLREVEMTAKGQVPEECKRILGYDANALYLYAISQDMPTGPTTQDAGPKPILNLRTREEWRTNG